MMRQIVEKTVQCAVIIMTAFNVLINSEKIQLDNHSLVKILETKLLLLEVHKWDQNLQI